MKIIDFILELVYPTVCGFCEDLNKEGICYTCSTHIKKYEISSIKSVKGKFYRKQAYIFKYKKEIRNIILKYKFNERAYLYKTFATIILNNQKICKYIEKYDYIIAVPIHKKRLIERGYNQSELILKEISKRRLNITFENKVLVKTKNNVPQSTLNKDERELNVKNVYLVMNSEKIKEKKVLIFDDISTTGNTVNECARVLIENGAKEVGILTLAR